MVVDFVVLLLAFTRSNGFLVDVDVEFSFLNLVVVVVELSFLRVLVLGGVDLDDAFLEVTLVLFLEGLRLLDLTVLVEVSLDFIVLVWFLEELRLLELSDLEEVLPVFMGLVWFLEELRLLDLMVLVLFLEVKVLGLIGLVWFLVEWRVVFLSLWCCFWSSSIVLLWS